MMNDEAVIDDIYSPRYPSAPPGCPPATTLQRGGPTAVIRTHTYAKNSVCATDSYGIDTVSELQYL